MIADKVKAILNENNKFAKKKFGQNFLCDKNILNKIMQISNITCEDNVIEIGPGLGCMSEFLLSKAKRLVCYEIDQDMVEILNNNLRKNPNLVIKCCDFLKVNLSEEIEKEFNSEPVKVVANLPYYITTPIIFKLIENPYIKELYIMVQKEVGQRLTGKPNTKDYNALSVFMKYKTISKIEFIVNPKSFYPSPQVDSALLSAKVKKSDYELNNEPNFLKFVQSIFNQRRKTLINNICDIYDIKKEDLIEKIEKMGFSKNVRSEMLELDEIVNIYKMLFE